ncbi:MAG: LysR family transcriptional regulator [Caulobacterales bacterium]
MSSWRGIEEFLAVVERGSFTAASEELGVSKSFVSKAVHDLEERLGVQLLVRTTRRLSMTAAGESFFQECGDLHRRFQALERRVGLYGRSPVGKLRVGLSDIFGSEYMSGMLASFNLEHPAIEIEIIAYLDEGRVSQEQYDLVIRYGKLSDSNLRARPFGYLSYCLCAAPEYVERHGWPSSSNDLANHRCLTDRTATMSFNDGDVIKVSPRWMSNSGIALKGAVRKGLGVASLPVSVIRRELAEGSVIALEEEWAYFDKECWAVYSPGMISAATRAFIDYLVRRIPRTKIRPAMAAQLALLE